MQLLSFRTGCGFLGKDSGIVTGRSRSPIQFMRFTGDIIQTLPANPPGLAPVFLDRILLMPQGHHRIMHHRRVT